MTSVMFFVPGKPKGKGRHRTRVVKTKTGKAFATQYPDPKSSAEETRIALYAKAAGVRLIPLLNEADRRRRNRVVVQIKIYQANPDTKPDLDNVSKLYLDALNGVAWDDDQQVCFLAVHKVGPRSDGAVGVAVKIEVMT